MQNNKTCFFYVLYSDKTWVFDQSESAPGPIYVLNICIYILCIYIYIYIFFFFFFYYFFQFSAQIKLTVQGLFDLNQNIPAFKEHLRDFMVQIKVGDWNVQH